MNARADGGPAFPYMDTDEQRQPYCMQHGMSLRDYFAAAALRGILAGPPEPQLNLRREAKQADIAVRDAYASVAYAFADAMLVARAK